MVVCIFEDDFFDELYPLTYNRHISELFYGTLKIKDRIRKFYPRSKIIFWGREYLKDFFLEKYPGSFYNEDLKDDTLFINSRVILKKKINVDKNTIILNDGGIVSFFLNKDRTKKINYRSLLKGKINLKNLKKKEIKFQFFSHIWDLIKLNGEFIKFDFNKFYKKNSKKNIYIGKNVVMSDRVSINSNNGPVIIEDNVLIEPFVYIEGPVYIGRNSKIKANASIYGSCSFEECDRISGEISSSIFLSYTNKQHYGFVGDSYIGSFVNLGAGTTTSNLKNTYSEIRVKISNRNINTRMQFLGSIIGDYSRTGIGTYLNTGTVIGIGTQIIGRKTEKYFPSFIFEKDRYSEYKLEKEFDTINKMKKRRGKILTLNERKLISEIFNITRNERGKFFKG